MQYIPGSHKWGEVMGYDFEGGAAVNAGVDVSKAVPVELGPGEAVFHHSLAMHYAGPNNTDVPRRAYITRFMPANTVYRFRKEGRDSQEQEGEPYSGEDSPILV
jgi:ectoine hydroxylase-related dioxygenase (phytanoyl-CoA dioxygenase family)